MTAVQYVEYLLENNWSASITDREKDVPKPAIHRESAEGYRKISLGQSDALLLRDGGITTVEPQSVGWVEERTVSKVTIDARTTGEGGSTSGRERLWGYRGVGSLGPNEAERYGGLMGEIKRILDSERKGDQEFSLVWATEQNDLSAQMGGQVWRGTTEVQLDVRGSVIDSST